jgi:hypothetical protein
MREHSTTELLPQAIPRKMALIPPLLNILGQQIGKKFSEILAFVPYEGIALKPEMQPIVRCCNSTVGQASPSITSSTTDPLVARIRIA